MDSQVPVPKTKTVQIDKTFLTPTQSPRSTADYQDLINDIEDLSAKINEYAEKNVIARTKYKELETQVDAITNALSQNVDILNEENRKLELRNQEIQTKIEIQEDLMRKLVLVYKDLATKGVNLKRFDKVDYDLLVHLAGYEIPINEEELNSTIKKITLYEPFFQFCHSNQQFLNRCADLIQMVSDQSAIQIPEPSHLSYEEKILRLQFFHDQTHAKIANEMKNLAAERTELLKSLQALSSPNQLKSSPKNQLKRSPKRRINGNSIKMRKQ